MCPAIYLTSFKKRNSTEVNLHFGTIINVIQHTFIQTYDYNGKF